MNTEPIENFDYLLRLMVRRNASDLFVTAGLPPSLKINGKIIPVTKAPLSPDDARRVVYSVMDPQHQAEFERDSECNFAINPTGVGRFRVNIFRQKQQVGMVLRKIETHIPTLEELRLPKILEDLALIKRGLVIVVGATGSGKSTTLASMVGYRNRNTSGHIVSIEDPIEYIHEHEGCVVTQREVGVDTESFEAALRNTLRQAPDVILIGEVRTRETMEHAITFAETGHLCLTTLHANNANQALDRIINFFPEERRNQLLLDLSLNLKAVVAQQLVPTPDRNGRRVAVEILLNTPLVSKYIHKGHMHKLKDLMGKSTNLGMQTFDQALYDLYSRGEISYDDAIHHADSANQLRLMIKLGKDADLDQMAAGMEGITLVDPEQE